ncbi:nicotinate-nucleotide adenylyltransferase [Thermoflavimicrobium dichotomicum]|uniref:Probable nicotinate-nucleotide adenylyltransferase n=1 Tax=Thermoflavimicrobium dichotomicum TaxID=46223 RepID=A0A1I3NLY4_9BACL|nr:nicotinate-nucleotide adenylyltransferase [Thermoflavimicrobium dichotomicum]SFJ10303.1 nicotinate-nucleotide adenylyltransferase [Thermoflavimicrobium dichotomicum]
MRVGIMGGTFDPIHIGHLLVAEQAREAVGLDQVLFTPAAFPPHKQDKKITPVEHRLRMVQLAIEDHPYFHLSDIELYLPSPSYTVRTLESLRKAEPHAQFYVIIGADMVNDLPNWYKIERILEVSQIVGIRRPDIQIEHLPSWIEERVIWVTDSVELNLSSTYIRERLARGMSIRYLVPDSVYQYIKGYRLYES